MAPESTTLAMPRSLSIRTLLAPIVSEHFLQWLRFCSSRTGGRDIKGMTNLRDRQNKSARQRERRLSRRNCGNCGNVADTMIKWGDGQSLAICQLCLEKLTDTPITEPYCAYFEMPPGDFRLMSDKVGNTVDDTAAIDTAAPRKSAVRAFWEWLWNL